MPTLTTDSLIARNTFWMSLGQGLRLAIQALYFTLIARSLGVVNYGAFVGVVALVGILYPFGTLGTGNLLVMHVARNKSSFHVSWGAALITTMLTGAFLITVVLTLSHFTLPASIPIRLVFLVAVSDMIGLNLTIVASQAFQAFSQLRWTAAIYVLISSSRLSAAILLVAFHHHPSALQWGYAYFASTVLIATTAVCMVCTKLGLPQVPRRPSHAEFIEGLYFSIGMSAQTIYNDIDKTMLARLGSLGATGIYGAAYRLIDVSFSPVAALLSATYPNFFRTGLGGVRSSFSYAKPLLTRAITYAVVVCVGILLCAGIVPSILGAEYARTTEALRWLSFLPVLKAAHYFLSDTLTGAGYQSVRSAIQACVAIFNISINLWLIPAYSWRGAAWSSIASDALLACGVGTAVWILGRSPVNPAAVVYNQ